MGERTTIWRWFGPKVRRTQGWKLYISCVSRNLGFVVDITKPIFERYKIPFKAISAANIQTLNGGFFGYSQVGKCVVSYYDDTGPPADLLEELNQLFSKNPIDHPAIPFAYRLYDDHPLFIRYGSFLGNTVLIDDVEVEDDRYKLEDPDVQQSSINLHSQLKDMSRTHNEIDNMLKLFPVFKSIRQMGKGGVFEAIDISSSSFNTVIVKTGYRYGSELRAGIDGAFLLAYEIDVIQMICNGPLAKYVPELIGFGHSSTMSMMVVKKVGEINLQQKFNEGTLTTQELEISISIIRKFHSRSYRIFDAKLENFVQDTSDGKIFLVDLESFSSEKERPEFCFSSFSFGNQIGDYCDSFDIIHFLTSILRSTPKATFSMNDRKVDLNQFNANYVADNDICSWAHKLLAEEFQKLSMDEIGHKN